MSRPDAIKWQIACAEELEIFRRMKLYEIVDRPTDRKVVDSKWVFKVKRGPDGEIAKHKARVVAKGYTQIEGLDYDETFAPVVKFTTIRVLLAISAHLDLEIHQVDIKTAFLNGELKEEIYLKPPPGTDIHKSLVWRLLKPLYGLKQAGRQWYQKVHAKFTAIGFTRLEADHSVFRKGKGDQLILVAVYVDDMLLFCKLISVIISFKEELALSFPTTDLGEARWILNMEITRDRNARTITLSQERYIETILDRHGMSSCHPVATPMITGLKLTKLAEAEVDPWDYQSRLGALMYAMLGTHPELAYPVTILSQHAATPGHEHLAALHRVFRYLRKMSGMKLLFRGGDDPLTLSAYLDADWANDVNDRRSIGGYVFLLAGGAVSWSSQKQKIIAQSSTEAEYVTGALTTNEAIWLRRLLAELDQIQSEATHLKTDNEGSIALARNPVFHKATKHIEVRYHHMRYSFESGLILPIHVFTDEQVADVLTKPLPREKHERFAREMGLVWE
jgi:hypothetical protein